MPQNKRESLIYSVMMCFTMVLWMSMYNVTLHMGGFSTEVLREGWLGFPIAVVFAFCMDWFVVSGPAKGVAFRFFVNRDSSVLKKVIVISTCMVVPIGDHHVFLWRTGSLCPFRTVEPAAYHLAYQHS